MELSGVQALVGKVVTFQALPYHEYVDESKIPDELRDGSAENMQKYNEAVAAAIVKVKVKYVVDQELVGFQYDPENRARFICYFADGSRMPLWEFEEYEFVEKVASKR